MDSIPRALPGCSETISQLLNQPDKLWIADRFSRLDEVTDAVNKYSIQTCLADGWTVIRKKAVFLQRIEALVKLQLQHTDVPPLLTARAYKERLQPFIRNGHAVELWNDYLFHLTPTGLTPDNLAASLVDKVVRPAFIPVATYRANYGLLPKACAIVPINGLAQLLEADKKGLSDSTVRRLTQLLEQMKRAEAVHLFNWSTILMPEAEKVQIPRLNVVRDRRLVAERFTRSVLSLPRSQSNQEVEYLLVSSGYRYHTCWIMVHRTSKNWFELLEHNTGIGGRYGQGWWTRKVPCVARTLITKKTASNPVYWQKLFETKLLGEDKKAMLAAADCFASDGGWTPVVAAEDEAVDKWAQTAGTCPIQRCIALLNTVFSLKPFGGISQHLERRIVKERWIRVMAPPLEQIQSRQVKTNLVMRLERGRNIEKMIAIARSDLLYQRDVTIFGYILKRLVRKELNIRVPRKRFDVLKRLEAEYCQRVIENGNSSPRVPEYAVHNLNRHRQWLRLLKGRVRELEGRENLKHNSKQYLAKLRGIFRKYPVIKHPGIRWALGKYVLETTKRVDRDTAKFITESVGAERFHSLFKLFCRRVAETSDTKTLNLAMTSVAGRMLMANYGRSSTVIRDTSWWSSKGKMRLNLFCQAVKLPPVF